MKNALYNKEKIYYSLIIKTGYVISIILCILVFLLTPDIKTRKNEIPYFPEPLITVIDIPQTDQSNISAPPRPATPAISSLFEPLDEPEPLGDFEIKETSSDVSKVSATSQTVSKKTGIYESTSFPFVPRQIVEVIPEKVEDAKGEIKLRLLIGMDGFVKSHNIVNNTLNNRKLYQNVTDAVYKSKWQPITFEGEKVEYWIEKTYTFN